MAIREFFNFRSMLDFTATKFIITALILLISWRVWRFTICPKLYPNSPNELPYWIPFIGHATSFFRDFNGAIEGGRKYFQQSREPFCMTVAGQTIYVATSPQDIGAVWKNTTTISGDPITNDMYRLSGFSAKLRHTLLVDTHMTARYNEGNTIALTPTQRVLDLHRQQLSGPRLDELVEKKVLPAMFRRLAFSKKTHPTAVTRTDNSTFVSLLDLTIDIFIRGGTDAFFDPVIFHQTTNVVDAFMQWEYSNWKFLFQLPEFLSRDMLDAQQSMVRGFKNYFSVERNDRLNQSFFVSKMEDILREVGLVEEQMGSFMLLHYWAIIGNTFKLGFWVMAHLVHDQELLEKVRLEVLPAVRGDFIDEKYLLEQCPQLEALVNETLRLTVTSSLARVVTETCVVGGKILQKGNKIMLPIRELHYEQRTWGPTPNILTANRFMDSPKLSKSLSYRPWGGGHTLCPGRHLARRSVNAFLAIILSRFDVAIESGTFPASDGARPSPGVVPVTKGEDLQLCLTPRY